LLNLLERPQPLTPISLNSIPTAENDSEVQTSRSGLLKMEQWYTLHTKPKAEYYVTAVLQQRGIETYLPEIESAKVSQGKKKRPFFPCYIFIKVDFEVVGRSWVQWTPGLRRIVAFDDQPVPLPDQVIELIRCRLGEIQAAGGWPAHPFKPGDTVRITEGPFRDMLAIFDGPTTPAQRVQVLLEILGRISRMQVDVNDLEKVSPCAEVSAPKRPRRTRGQGRRINGVH
jgi:transcriptional antiterminator RfaH